MLSAPVAPDTSFLRSRSRTTAAVARLSVTFPFPRRKTATSSGRNRLWPPAVFSDGSSPPLAQRLMDASLTPRSRAASLLVNHLPPLTPLMLSAPVLRSFVGRSVTEIFKLEKEITSNSFLHHHHLL